MTNTNAIDLQRTSPCYDRSTIDGVHSLYELELIGKLNIRGNPNDPAFMNGLEKTLGVTLPTSSNSLHRNGPTTLFWLGPDEWLLHCELDQTATLEQRIRQGLEGLHFSVTEVTDYYTVLRLSGPQSEALLRRGTPLDLHTSIFSPDSMAQTRFGHASVSLLRLSDGVSWEIQVRWTYAQYVWDYLVSAMDSL
jgi:sarcosine oxidase subunit gamma